MLPVKSRYDGAFLFAILLALVVFVLSACAPSRTVREGQRLFAGCQVSVDDKATLNAGVFVCKGARDPAPFAGNGRSCGSCHIPGDNFGLDPRRVATLAPDDPLFFDGLEEDQKLLRDFGLIFVVAPDVSVEQFRQTPKLVHLRRNCKKNGDCDSLGLLGDRAANLDAFTIQAIMNHLAKSPARVPGVDFRLPTAGELKAIRAYQRSTLVSEQDERN